MLKEKLFEKMKTRQYSLLLHNSTTKLCENF